MGFKKAFKKAFKKCIKEIQRPFKRASRFAGKTFKIIGFKKFGNYVENMLNEIIDSTIYLGAAMFGGPIGVAAINALTAYVDGVSAKDIFKSSLIGGMSLFTQSLTNGLINAKSLGLVTNIIQNKNDVKGILYGVGDLICPSNQLLVTTIKTIASKDIDKQILDVVGLETGKYLQAYVNTSKSIESHIKHTKKIEEDIILYNFVRNEMIPPYNESLKSKYVNDDHKIKNKFMEIYDKINSNTWKLKEHIAKKSNQLFDNVKNEIINSNTSLKTNLKISAHNLDTSMSCNINIAEGLSVSADHKSLGVSNNSSSTSFGLSTIYPRGLMVKYSTHKPIESFPININGDILKKTNHGYCFTHKTYNTVGIDSIKMTTEMHVNSDCMIGAGLIAAVPQLVIPAAVVMTPVIASANTDSEMINSKMSNSVIPINKKSLSYKINSGKYPKLNYKLSQMIKEK